MSDKDRVAKKFPEGEEPSSLGSLSGVSTKLRELFGAIKHFYHNHQGKFNIMVAGSAFVIQALFQDEMEQILPAAFGWLGDFLTSNTGVAFLVVMVIALQAWSLKWISAVERKIENVAGVRTDGGSKNLPSRDEKGQFTSSDSGPSMIFILAILLGGYLIGSQYGDSEAVVGLLIAFLLLSFTNNL